MKLAISTLFFLSLLGQTCTAAQDDNAGHIIIEENIWYAADHMGIDSFAFRMDYVLEYWTLFGEPVFYCNAKWEFLPGYDVNLSAKGRDGTSEISSISLSKYDPKRNSIRPYDIEILVPLSTVDSRFKNLFFVCDPGALQISGNGYGLNSPGSPEWDRAILFRDDVYGRANDQLASKTEKKPEIYAQWSSYGISSYRWLNAASAKDIAKQLKSIMDKNPKNIVFKKRAYSVHKGEVSPAIKKVSFDMSGLYKYFDHLHSPSFKKTEASKTSANTSDDFWSGKGVSDTSKSSDSFWLGKDDTGNLNLAAQFANRYEKWERKKMHEINTRELPKHERWPSGVIEIEPLYLERIPN